MDELTTTLIYRIVTRIEDHGVGRFEYILYEETDLDAIISMVILGDADEQITFTVHGLEVTVYGTADVNVQPKTIPEDPDANQRVIERIESYLINHHADPAPNLSSVLDPEALTAFVENGDPEHHVTFQYMDLTITVFGDDRTETRPPDAETTTVQP